MNIKAVGLISGGLDSILAVKLVKDQGIDVDVIKYDIGFAPLHLSRRLRKKKAEVTHEEMEEQLGVTVQVIDVAEEFLDIVLHPAHGHGSEMNPCIDCKVFMLRKAKAYMETHGAQLVFTGEVVGQRPMSQQRNTLRHSEKASGLEGYLLRPLSAKLLEPTIPEQKGWVDRERLLDIAGRGRKRQLALARHYHLSYQQPAGGCLLNDPNFSRRLQDLFARTPEDKISTEEVNLLKLGRHFRLSDSLRVIIGRHELDNEYLEKYIQKYHTASVRDHAGPVVLIDGDPADEQLELIAQLAVRHTKAKHAGEATVDFSLGDQQRAVTIRPDKTLDIARWRIA